MDAISKAVNDLIEAVKVTETVERIKVTLTFVKPKPKPDKTPPK